MDIRKTLHPLSQDMISVALVMPRGARHDSSPNEHHIMEHLILEKRMPDGCKIRDYADKNGVILSGVTSRDSVTITFLAQANPLGASNICRLLSSIFLSEWTQEDEENVVAVVENEIFAIASNMMLASKLTAELTYWGEESNLEHGFIRSTMQMSSQKFISYHKDLLNASLLLIDDPTDELYSIIRSNEQVFSRKTSIELSRICSEKKQSYGGNKEPIKIPVRPANLSSLVLGINRYLNSLEQLSVLAITLCLSRNMRKGVIWDAMQLKGLALYHVLSWFQPSLKDAVLVIDWVSTPSNELTVKRFIIELIKNLTEGEELLAQELPMAIKEITTQLELIKNTNVTERLKAVAREMAAQENLSSYKELLNEIGGITPKLCIDIFREFTRNNILFINQKAYGQFEAL